MVKVGGFLVLITLAFGVAAEARAQAGNTLPLQRGFYVRKEVACPQASNATLMLVTRDGMNVSRVLTKFTKVQKTGATTYQVTEVSEDLQGKKMSPTVQVYEVPDRTTFSLRDSSGVFTFRYCPQNSLPEPWRNNDIRSMIN